MKMPKYRFEDIAFNITKKRKPTSDDMKTYIGLEHLESGSLYVKRWGSDVPIKGDKLLMQKGDILFGKRNAYLRRAAIAPHDGLFSAHGMILRPNEKVISKKLFPFFICSDYFFDAAIRISVGSLSPTINWSALKELEFMLPDMNEQEKLADLLWAANDTKEAYKRLLYLTGELIKSQFIEMFGDPKENPLQWVIYSFNEFATIDANMTTEYEKYADYPHIGIDSIERNTGKLIGYRTVKEDNVISGKYIFTPEHIIYSKIRPILNKVALPDFEGLCSADAYPILPNSGNCNRVFLATAMRSQYFIDYVLQFSARSHMPKVNRKQLSGFKMPLPPLVLQNQFADIVLQTDKSKLVLEQNLDNLETTIKALMSQNFG